MDIKKVVVIGGGVLGSQIAFQTAYCGFDVTIVARDEEINTVVRPKLKVLLRTYKNTISKMKSSKGEFWARGIADKKGFNEAKCTEKATNAYKNIIITSNYNKAFKDCDLVIESITENIDIKRDLYENISSYLPKKTIIVTNSSTLLPSQMAKSTGRPNKYLSLHFANSIWKNNTAEIMCQEDTDRKSFKTVVNFANSIRMVALPVYKEKRGYLLNSMLVPFLLSAFDLYASGVSDPESIDKAWKYGTGAPNGPFEIIDVVGLETVKNIVDQYKKVPELLDPLFKKMLLPYNYKEMLEIIEKMIKQGKTGKACGEGFYKYRKK